MNRIIRIVLLIFLLFLPVPFAAQSGMSIVGGLTHEKTCKIGDTYRGVILIKNTGEKQGDVKVYKTDYLFFSDGSNIYGEPGKDPRSNAGWVTFSPKYLTIPPGQISKVHYTVKVPDDRTLIGTYWSMLMVEGIDKPSQEPVEKEKGITIRQVIRYGIQIVTNIENTGTRRLKFINTKLLKEENIKILQVDLENIGERKLRASLYVELYDEKGAYTGMFEGNKLRIYPGTSVRFKINLSEVPEGTYKAMIIADCGGDDLFGASYTLKFKK